MAQIFHPSTNTLSRVSIVGAVFLIAGLAWVLDALGRSPYATRALAPRDQPAPFSHKHHVSGIGIDCRYCHTSVEESSFAGLPPTKTCMSFSCTSATAAASPGSSPAPASAGS